MPCLRLPDGLRRYAGGEPSLQVTGSTVAEALAAAFLLHPDLRLRLVDEAGRVRPYLLVFRNQTELARERVEDAWLGTDDTLTFLEAIGGGSD